jgi:hypothetical protein
MTRNQMLGIPISKEEMDLLNSKFEAYKEESGMVTENFTNWNRCILLNHCKPKEEVTQELKSFKDMFKEFLMDEDFKKFWGMKDDARPVQ